jgi:hypothetical protein
MFNDLHNLQEEIQKKKNKKFHSLSITQKKLKQKGGNFGSFTKEIFGN